MSETRFNHLALLLPSVERASGWFKTIGYPVGSTQVWDDEGTKEIYIGDRTSAGRLLLMEPVKSGAYSNALNKRGPGLHHIAIDVLNLEEFILSLAGTGWLLHPKSLSSIKKSQTAWLARPGMPTLIEVQQRDSLEAADYFVTHLAMKLSTKQYQMMNHLGLKNIVSVHSSEMQISIGSLTIPISKLVN